MKTLPAARTYNQHHIPRPHSGGRRISIYWTWSYPWEAQRSPGEMYNRFSTMTEVRNTLWPSYETPAYDEANFLQGIAGTLELFHRSTLAFQELAGQATGHPVAVFQRIDQAGYKLPIDERILADTDTLMVFGLDHILSEQEAEATEINAISEWLQREGTCLLLAPHHDVGFTNDFSQRQVEYQHHGDPLVPRQQRFGQYTRSLMKALEVPIHNKWGLRPAVVDGTEEIEPLTATEIWMPPAARRRHHLQLPPPPTALRTDRSRIRRTAGSRTPAHRPKQATSIHRGRKHRIQCADLDAARRTASRRHRSRRLHQLHHLVRRHRQPQEPLAQPRHHEVAGLPALVLTPTTVPIGRPPIATISAPVMDPAQSALTHDRRASVACVELRSDR